MRDCLREDYRWTPRQRQVLDLMARGKTNSEIGEALGISLAGAKWHVSEILSKLNSDSREEAAEYWRQLRRPRPPLRAYLPGAAPLAGAALGRRCGGGNGGRRGSGRGRLLPRRRRPARRPRLDPPPRGV